MGPTDCSRLACRGALAAVLVLGTAFAPEARAQQGNFYVGLNVPVMFIDDTDSTTSGTQAGLNPQQLMVPVPYRSKSKSEYDTGFKVAGVVGYELGGGLRVEGELFFARAEVAKVTYKGVNAGGMAIPITVDVPISGTADQFGGFASVWYDIDTGSDWIPYVGGGLGFIRVDQGDLDYDSNGLAEAVLTAQARAVNPNAPAVDLLPGTVPDISTADTVFAYHFGAGVGYRLTDNVILQAGYRFQAASDLEFEGENPGGSVRVESSLRAHLLEVGVRYRF